MNDTREPLTAEEENDEGSSFYKKIEELDKNDQQYNDKRSKLLEQLDALLVKMQKLRKKLKKQQAESHAAMSVLKNYVKQDPQNGELQKLLDKVAKDNKFVTRAIAENLTIRGDVIQEKKRLISSQEFNLPIDAKTITDASLKPLPSAKIQKRKEKIQEISTKENTVRKARRPLSISQKILALRTSSPGKTMAGKISTNQKTR